MLQQNIYQKKFEEIEYLSDKELLEEFKQEFGIREFMNIVFEIKQGWTDWQDHIAQRIADKRTEEEIEDQDDLEIMILLDK